MLALSEGIAGRVCASGEPVVLPDLTEAEDLSLLRSFGEHAAVALEETRARTWAPT